MDRDRLIKAMHEGDPGAAEELLVHLRRRGGDRVLETEAQFALLLKAMEDGNSDQEIIRVSALVDLEGFDYLQGYFPDEVARIELIDPCPNCGDTGYTSFREARTGRRVQVTCKRCKTSLPIYQEGSKKARALANLILKMGMKVENGYEMLTLYYRCVRRWYPEHWELWCERNMGYEYNLSDSYEGKIVVQPVFRGPLRYRMRELPEDPCGGDGGCWACNDRWCPQGCDYDEDDYKDEKGYFNCPGSRYGACRGSSCDVCDGKHLCTFCGRGYGEKLKDEKPEILRYL